MTISFVISIVGLMLVVFFYYWDRAVVVVRDERTTEVAPLPPPSPPEVWALLYLHDWDPDGKVYPEISRIYYTWQEAEADRLSRIEPWKYWVRNARMSVLPLA